MKRSFALSLVCVLTAALLPLLVWRAGEAPEAAPAPSPAPAEADSGDGRRTLTVLTLDGPVTMTMAAYLPGVLAGEMPASFAPDALRAQAVAARTYALYCAGHSRGRHPEADVCCDPGCCQAWLDEDARRALWGGDFDRWEAAVRAAAADTDGAILRSGGEPILACFHSSSPGMTESSERVWGQALPYLVSVDSPESADTVPRFVTTVRLSAEEFRAVAEAVCPAAALTGPPESWIGQRITDPSGRVAVQTLGGAEVSGEALRRAFSLRSTCFTLVWEGDCFLFTVTGSGHGVGMSQYGAQLLARQGLSWREILAHYYPGTELAALS